MSGFIPSGQSLNYCINISEHYCSHWQPVHALRQVLQNWLDMIREKFHGKKIVIQSYDQPNLGIYRFYPVIDGIKNQSYYIHYDKVQKILELTNQGSFKVQNMLMGASTKMGNNITLGQFGEGMKLYLLILLKYKHNVYIQSGEYYYGPILDKWVYEYKDLVLFVHIKKREGAKKDNTRVIIKNVDQNLFVEFKYLSLSLVKGYSVIEDKGRRLIISDDPKITNRLYKKGILIGMRFNIGSIYGYDLDQISIGRDRDSINDPQNVKRQLSQLHAYVLNNHEELQKRADIRDKLEKHLNQSIAAIKRGQFRVYYTHCYISHVAADKIYRRFLIQNKKQQLYPVSSSSTTVHINNQLKLYGLQQNFYPTIQTGSLHHANLVKSTKHFQSIDTKIKKYLTNDRQMIDSEKKQFGPIKTQIATLFPEVNTYTYRVSGLKEAHCYRSADNKTIYVNIEHMRANNQLFRKKLTKLILYDI